MSSDTYIDQVARWRAHGDRIVFTNGCFDLMHPGHVHYLRQASLLGDRLILGLNDDDSVRRLKGGGRPILDLGARTTVLSALRMVDLVIAFHEDTPLRLIQEVRPDVLVKGGDYTIDEIVGGDYVLSTGGKVKALGFVPGMSTSEIIEKIKSTL